MALDLGDLVGYIKLDDKNFDTVLDKLPGKMQNSSKKMLGASAIIGAAVAAALISGIADAMNFDATNDKVAAQLGLLPVESARVGTLAGTLYAQNYGESMEAVQSTVGAVITQIKGMGTASDAEVEGMTAKVLDYASAFGVETADSIALVQQLMTSGLAPDAATAMDLMVTAMQKVPEALRGDMTDAITEYGPIMAAMGFSGQEAFDLLAKGSEKGMYGIDKAGDAVKEFGIRSTDMSKTSGEAYDILGLSQGKYTDMLLEGGETGKKAFDRIVGGLKRIKDPTEQSQAALALFGTPLEDLSVSEIPAFLGSLTDLGGGFADTAGAAEDMGTTLNDNAASQMETVKRQVELLFASIGEKLLPILSDVMAFFIENEGAMQAVIGILGFLALAFVGVSVATWVMNTALLASPLTWIILGIMALVAILIFLAMNTDAVAAWIADAWGAFTAWFMQQLDVFMGHWNRMWTAVWEWVVSIWNGIVTWVLAVVAGFVAMLVAHGARISAWWNALWSGIGKFISAVWLAIVAAVVGFITGLVSGIRSRFEAVVSFLSGVWTGILSTAKTLWGNLVSFITGIPGKILGALQGAGTLLLGIGKDIIGGLKKGVEDAVGGLMDFIGGIGAGIADTFANILDINSPSRVFEGFGKNTIQGYLNGLDKLQPELDARMGLVVEPPKVQPSSAQAAAAGNGGQGSYTASSSLVIHGNVGWDADEVARQMTERQRQAAALAGLNDVVVVA